MPMGRNDAQPPKNEKNICDGGWEKGKMLNSRPIPCTKEAVGVIPLGIGHRYVCEEHAKQAENEGWDVDYENDRL